MPALFVATLSAAAALIVLGLLLLWNGPLVERAAKAFPRSKAAGFVFFGGGAAWFIAEVAQLGPADFGEYRQYFVIFFGAVAIAAFFVSRDFLAVRGVAILLLLCSRLMLDASLVIYPPPDSRRVLNVFVYILIGLALYFGTMPYQLRDFFGWLFHKPSRPRALGAACAVYGLVLAAIATTY